MRILHVSAYYAPAYVYGGPPRSIHGLCRALIARGADVAVLTTDANGDGALPPDVTGAGVFEGVPVRYFPRTWPNQPIGSRALVAALRRELRHADVVHLHGLWNRVVWAASRAAAGAGVPYVLSPRGMFEAPARAHHGWRKRLSHLLFDQRVLAGAAALHATSAAERVTLEALGLAPVTLVPNGITLPSSPPPPAALDGPPMVLFIGRVHPIKRIDLLLDAFALVHAARPDARLVIAGPDERGLQASLSARQPSLGGVVRWTGEVDAAQRTSLLRDARALVLCSDSESFGLTVVEAMAAARPVVVARTCGWTEVSQQGAGLVVEQTIPALGAAIEHLLADPAGAAAMGARGFAFARERYSWGALAPAFLDLYETARTPFVARLSA